MSSTEPVKEPAQAPAAEPIEEPTEESTVASAQVDGSGEPANGSPLAEAEYKVEVKLADMQADPNNPLYSAKSFEELNL
jgi:ATP-dependent RNA helicase DDX19/DBP5